MTERNRTEICIDLMGHIHELTQDPQLRRTLIQDVFQLWAVEQPAENPVTTDRRATTCDHLDAEACANSAEPICRALRE